MIPAAHATSNSGKIVKAEPELGTKITDKLLNLDETHRKSGRKDLIKAGAIEAFSEYFEETEDKEKIIEFVKEQMESKSSKARKTAREFLRKWGRKREVLLGIWDIAVAAFPVLSCPWAFWYFIRYVDLGLFF